MFVAHIQNIVSNRLILKLVNDLFYFLTIYDYCYLFILQRVDL
jgi:hypothetical protein